MSNELVDLVLFHGRNEGLFSFNLAEMRRRYQSNDFTSSAWLPIYEVGRRGWDTSASFSKIGTFDDPGGLYDHLRQQAVEFYITGPGQFDVESFEGWHLSQQHFEAGDDGEEAAADIFHQGLAYIGGGGWENYD